MFGAPKTPFGGSAFGSSTSAFGTQQTTPFGATSGGLFGSKTPAAGTFGTPSFGAATPSSSGLFGGTSTGSSLFGNKTTQSTTGFGFGGTTSTGGLFGGTSVFQAPQAASSFVFGQQAQAANGTTVKFVPPTSSEQAQKSGISLTIKTQNQCITVMEQYKNKCVEELRLEDYTAGRKTGSATTGFGTTGSGLFGTQTTSTGGLFGTTPASATTGFGFGNKTSTSGGLFGQTSGGLFGAKTTSSLFGTTTTTTSAFGFGGSGGLFGKTNSTGTGLFGTTTTPSTGLFGSGFGTTAPSAATGLFGGTTAFGQPPSQSTSVFGQTAKPAFGFGATGTGFGTTGTSLFGNTSSAGGLFGATSKPTFSFGGTGGGFGATSTGFGGFGTTTASTGGLFGGTSTGSTLFGNKPTGFGTTGFGATSTGGSLFGGSGLGTTGFGGFGTSQTSGLGLGASTLGGLSNIDQSTLAALQQQQLIQQQLKALANTPFGDSPLFRNLTDSVKAKSTQNLTNITAKEPLNTSHYKVLSRPAARVKPRPVSSPSLGKSRLFEGLEEEGDFSPHPLVPRRSVKKLVIKNKSHHDIGSPFEEGQLKLRLRTDPDDDLVAPSPEVVKTKTHISNNSPVIDNESKSLPFIDTLTEFNHEESTPTSNKTKDYVLTPLATTTGKDISIGESNNNVIEATDNEPKCKLVLKRAEYYTKPSIAELDENVNEEHSQCLVQGFTVGRDGYGEVKFLGVTDVYALNLDNIVTFRRKEVEVYADNYPNKPEIGKELNKPAEITLLKVWPNDKSRHTPVKTPERLKESGFIDRIEEKTQALDAIFIDYRPKEGAWVFKVNHFTRYGMQEEFIDDGLDMETRKRLAERKLNFQPLSRLAADRIDFEKDDIGVTKEEMKLKLQMKLESIALSQEDSQMEDDEEDVIESSVMIENEENDFSEMDDFLPASHQLGRVADVEPFHLQGMKTSVLCDDEDDEMAVSKLKKKKIQLFSNKSIFSNSFAESSKPSSPFPKLELSTSIQVLDPLNSSVFQNISLNDQGSATKFQKKKHLFQKGVLDKSQTIAQNENEDSCQIMAPSIDDNLFIKCQTYEMVPYERSLLFAKTYLVADAGLVHSREFNVRWCSNMNLVHTGKLLCKVGSRAKKLTASVFTGNFVSSSLFGLGNSEVNIEKIEKNASPDLKQFVEDCLQINLKNAEFVPGVNTALELAKLKVGVEALTDYTEKANSYKLATVSSDLAEFRMHSCIWDLLSALWGKQDEDIESLYEIHAGRREAFSKWLSNVVDNEVQAEIGVNKTTDEGHLAVIFSLISGNNVRAACQVARDNKEFRLAFMLAQLSGDHHLKQYMTSQLCLWEERKIDLYMNVNRLKLYVLLSGMMVWKSMDTCINICENLDWKRSLALHLWYYCSSTATINDAFAEYQHAFKGTEVFEPYAPYPAPGYLRRPQTEVEDKTKDICYHIISLYCKRSHSMEKLLTPKTYTAAPLDYHLSWHLHEVLCALGYTHLSQDKHHLLQHSYAAELESMGLWHWAVFVLMHLQEDTRREYCVKELLNRYCRVSDEDDVMKLTVEERTIVDKFNVPVQWVHEAKALHAKYMGRHYDESLHLMRAGHWDKAHLVVLKHLTCDAIIEDDHEMLKQLLQDMNLPERCCTIKNWRIGGQVFLDYILLDEKLQGIRSNKNAVTSYLLEDLEGEVASVMNRINLMKVETSRERLCQSEMARNCSNMQKFVLSFMNTKEGDNDDNDENPKWSSMKVAPYVVELPLPPDYYLKELRELLENYANEIELNERNT